MRTLVALALLLLAAVSASAQGTLSGSVADQTGGVLPGTTVTLFGAGERRFETTDDSGSFTFRDVPAGDYDVSAQLPGFAEATARVSVGAGSTEMPRLVLGTATINDTVVVSASKTDMKLLDAPATMSVIGANVLESAPGQNYGDLLRSVPGINAIQTSARDVNLTSRAATSTLSNTELVLLDGRSVYLDFFGLVLWDMLPTNLSDIRQIEVVRGPASAVWGANAVSGAVNIITKSPRESVGTNVTLSAGGFSRNAGSTAGKGMGSVYGANATVARAPNATWSYRLSAGYFNSDAYPRPAGRIPLIPDPRTPGATVGGGFYPIDGAGATGSAFANAGTRQPKFDARVDQEVGEGRISYTGGVAGSSGIIHTGIGPFNIQPGSYSGYSRVAYNRKALKASAFLNVTDTQAPNLLLPDPLTGKPLQLNFLTRTFDLELGDSKAVGGRQVLTFGGNLRRNLFDITIAPNAKDRTEFGAYLQDEIFLKRLRITAGLRADKFGNLDTVVFSPRFMASFKLFPDHALRGSVNRAFRSPSAINNYLDLTIVNPVDLRGLAPLLPAPFQPLVANPFPLLVRGVGSEYAVGGKAQATLTESSVTAYEVGYTGTFARKTTVTAAFYVNRNEHDINFVQLPNNADPYTSANPPPGWVLPASLIDVIALRGIYLPRTAFTYLNLGPTSSKGLELSLDQQFTKGLSAFVNYSYQAKPTILDDPDPYPAAELGFPPANRVNVGLTLNGERYLVNGVVSYTDTAFWSDVLTSGYHGYTDAYSLVNGTLGRKWAGGRYTTSLKVTNLLNQDIQQHIFGDITKRSIVGELRVSY
ncbi:MAG: TonB-dependent receptor [Vicinamibacterales bacterium]